jgi:hypothetical protein
VSTADELRSDLAGSAIHAQYHTAGTVGIPAGPYPPRGLSVTQAARDQGVIPAIRTLPAWPERASGS